MKKYSLTIQLFVFCLTLGAIHSYATAPIVGYFPDTYHNQVDSLGSDGSINVLYGASTGLNFPTGITTDSSGNLYVANPGNTGQGTETILKFTPSGGVSTYSSDPALYGVWGIAFGPSGNLYAANSWVGDIVELGQSQDTYFNLPAGHYPWGIVVDANNNIYSTDHATSVFKINSSGAATLLGDGFTASAGITLSNGELYVADEGANNVTIVPTGPSVLAAAPSSAALFWSGNTLYDMTHANGNANYSISTSGVATLLPNHAGSAYAQFMAPSPTGVGYFADTYGNQVDILNANGSTTVVYGSSMGFNYPTGLAVDASGNLYVANNCYSSNTTETILKITPAGALSTFASDTNLYGVRGIALGANGNIYAANAWQGSVVEVAQPSDIFFNLPSGEYPWGVAVDGSGNVYVTDDGSNVYKFYAPSSGAKPGAPLLLASGFSHANGIVFGPDHNLYVSDDNGVQEIELVHKTLATGITDSAALAWFNGLLYDITQYGNQVYSITSGGTPTALTNNNTSPYTYFLTSATAGTGGPGGPTGPLATILNGSVSANANDAVFLQGDSFGSNPLVRFSANYYSSSPSWTNLTNLTYGTYQQSSGVSVRIPSGTTAGLFAFEVSADNGNSWSQPYFVNQAHGMHFDTPQVAAGKVFRVFGRNLMPSGSTPTVRLVDNASPHPSLPATVNTSQSNLDTLNVTAPSGVQGGHTYTVYVSNGYTGGEFPADLTVQGYNVGSNTDVWNLGVPWGCDFAPFYSNVVNAKTSYGADNSGATNAQTAIQNAINAVANEGGGVVYLPAGTYLLAFNANSAPGLTVPSNVVLEGAGINQTTITFNGTTSTAGSNPAVLIANGGGGAVQTCGLANLAVQNADTTHAWHATVELYDYPPQYQSQSLPQSQEVMLKSVKISSVSGILFLAGPADRVAVQNCDFEMLGGTYSPVAFYIQGLSNVLFQNNIVNWSAGQVTGGSGLSQGIIEGNTFTREYNYPQEINTRGIDMCYAANIVIQNNTFTTTGTLPSSALNAGETITSEQGNTSLGDSATGTVTGSSSNMVVDSSKNWNANSFASITGSSQTNYSTLNYPVVMIVDGKGAGQCRYLSGASGTTLTVSSPWTIQPAAGSVYSVLDWSNVNWLIYNNTMSGNFVGIEFWWSSNDNVAIYNNTLTNNQGITFVNASDTEQGNTGAPRLVTMPSSTAATPLTAFLPTWDSQVVGNTVTDSTGATAAFIGTDAEQQGNSPVQGMLELGVEVRGNTVTGYGTAFAEANAPNSYEPYTEGFWNMLTIENDNVNFVDNGTPAIFGTVLQNNFAYACNINNPSIPYGFYTSNNQPEAAGGFRIDSGSYSTLILTDTVSSGATKVEDSMLNNTTHASVGTYNGN